MKGTILTILTLVMGVVLQLGYLVYTMYVLLGIMLLSRFFTQQWADGLVASRSYLPESADIGEQQKISVTITDKSALKIPWLIFEESLPRSAMAQTPPKIKTKGNPLGITKLGPQESREVAYTVTFNQRGYYQFGPLLLETGDLFGLHRRFRIVTEPQFVLIPPAQSGPVARLPDHLSATHWRDSDRPSSL
ncbi:MAG: hypothetical protein M2R45_00863 [Verrucomicrobia subdivision 3 bacterium]|nr:hypothetical protein [Limisphaerales bacterium]MCS1414531.1 hypothetical protein [Limisphaerales bacterium]